MREAAQTSQSKPQPLVLAPPVKTTVSVAAPTTTATKTDSLGSGFVPPVFDSVQVQLFFYFICVV